MVVQFPTPQSIEAAKAAMLAERQEAMDEIGAETFVIVCFLCNCEVQGIGFVPGQAEGKADRAYAQHYLSVHGGAA